MPSLLRFSISVDLSILRELPRVKSRSTVANAGGRLICTFQQNRQMVISERQNLYLGRRKASVVG